MRFQEVFWKKSVVFVFSGKLVYNRGMYSRQFREPPEHLVQNGKAHFGCYEGVSTLTDIRGMRAPYAGVPVPSIISNLRIKSRLEYVFSLKDFIGLSQFYDFKVLGLGEIIFWNKETGKKYVYHTIMTPRRRFVPVLTTKGICASYKRSRFIKISWGRQHKHHALTFKVKGDNARPNAEGYVYSPLTDDMHTDSLFVSPSPASMRCSATWFSSMKTLGHIAINGEPVQDSEGLGMMILNRAYYKFHSKSSSVYGIGNVHNKNIVFYINTSNMDAADSDSYNSNILVVDGKKTALPPVYMTHPFGIDKNWIIQDTESMVDLTFTPLSVNSRTLNLIALRTSYYTMYGTFEGVLLTSDGEKIILKNFPGMLHKGMLRL